MSIRCKHCSRSTASSGSIARHLGWRMFSGVSLTGKPLDDVVCPWCAGTAPEAEGSPSWRVRCNTCEWDSATDAEVDGDEPVTGKDAYLLASDHRCDPWIEVQRPGDDNWLPRRYLNRDGTPLDDDRMKHVMGASS